MGTADISPVTAEDFPRMLEVWEASVRDTHLFLSEADIQIFMPLVRAAFHEVAELACVRDSAGAVAGFIAVADGKIEMLFVHPEWHGQGIGRRLISYATETLGASTVDVNEQNEQALGFYRHMGFEVEARSERDGLGKPFPLLHMRLSRPDRTDSR